jgi:hypothetical protein
LLAKEDFTQMLELLNSLYDKQSYAFFERQDDPNNEEKAYIHRLAKQKYALAKRIYAAATKPK